MAKNDNTTKIVRLAMLTALSVVLVAAFHFPIFPAAPYLEYDPADIPVLLAGLMYGPIEGLIVAAAASIIQGLTVSAGSGVTGIIMHFLATGSLVLVSSLIAKRSGGRKVILGLVLGALTMVVVMCGWNLVFTPMFTGMPVSEVAKMLVPIIIPFNAIKAGVNALLTFIIYKATERFFRD